jgi:hypothetical protein
MPSPEIRGGICNTPDPDELTTEDTSPAPYRARQLGTAALESTAQPIHDASARPGETEDIVAESAPPPDIQLPETKPSEISTEERNSTAPQKAKLAADKMLLEVRTKPPLPDNPKPTDYRRYHFHGPAAQREAAVTQYYDALATSDKYAQLPREVRATPQEETHLAAINKAALQVGQELGVDMRDRLITPDEVHFFDAPDPQISPHPHSVGHHSDLTGIRVVRGPTEVHNLSRIAHEAAHGFEAVQIKHQTPWQQPHKVALEVSSGSAATLPRTALRESITDMARDYLMSKAGHTTIATVYPADNLLLQGVIEQAAAHFKIAPRSLALGLIKDTWTGGTQSVDLIQRHMGERFQDYLHLPSGLSAKQARTAAVRIGLDNAADQLQAFIKDKQYAAFQWLF